LNCFERMLISFFATGLFARESATLRLP